ncbi:MAG: hypothetical protein KF703_15985 [Actinobacteria bacterium]|nr:hypothetical protein [Actinomycetota bacterium]
MGRFADKWAEADRMLRAVLEPSLHPGEALVGAVHANEPKTFSTQLYAVGVTPERLVVQPVDRRWAPKGDARSITRADVTGCSVWGWGGGVGSWLSTNADQQIRIETADGKLELMVLGGTLTEDALAGEGQLRGLDALSELMLSTRR